MSDLDFKAAAWAFILGAIAIFLLGYQLGLHRDRINNREKLALSVDEAVALLQYEYSEILAAGNKVSSSKDDMRKSVEEACSRIAIRLYDNNVKRAYKLYAKRDQILETLRTRL